MAISKDRHARSQGQIFWYQILSQEMNFFKLKAFIFIFFLEIMTNVTFVQKIGKRQWKRLPTNGKRDKSNTFILANLFQKLSGRGRMMLTTFILDRSLQNLDNWTYN